MKHYADIREQAAADRQSKTEQALANLTTEFKVFYSDHAAFDHSLYLDPTNSDCRCKICGDSEGPRSSFSRPTFPRSC